MQEVIVRLMLMHLPFEYRHDGPFAHRHQHGVEEGRSAIGIANVQRRRIVVEEG
jgi:hypothetical protein